MKSKKLKKKVAKRTKKPARRKIIKRKALKRKPAVKAKKKKYGKTKTAKAKGSKLPVSPVLGLEEVGLVVHYFPHVKAGVIKITSGRLCVGDMLYIKGHTTDFKQPVNSMQIDHVSVNEATRGQEIGLLVKARVRVNDAVYKL